MKILRLFDIEIKYIENMNFFPKYVYLLRYFKLNFNTKIDIENKWKDSSNL